MFADLREFIDKVRQIREYREIQDADWNLEIGLLTELLCNKPNNPLLLFDHIKGYPPGYRVASNPFATPRRVNLALGLPLEAKGIEQVRAWREKIRGGPKLIPPQEVAKGPVMQNVREGEAVDLLQFPAPKWHELDGGRYIGTGCCAITRDPDTGYVNLATQRVQVHDRNIATIMMAAGRHNDIIRKKYWKRGQACPVAVSMGQEPMLWASSTFDIPYGTSEYDFTGWLNGHPVPVVKGVATGLPVPATAEIVLDGELVSPEVDTRREGPFGEWPGYYISGARPEPVFLVKAVMFRDSPIIQGNPPVTNYDSANLGRSLRRSATVWEELERQIPGIKGVWLVPGAKGPSMLVISVEQQYPGHAKQAALIAAGCNATAYLNKFIIVVDEDIDPANMDEVLWSLGTRCDPETSIDIIRGSWGSIVDPILPPEKKEKGDFTYSRAIILACKPYHWRDKFPPSIKPRPELARQIQEKWAQLFQEIEQARG